MQDTIKKDYLNYKLKRGKLIILVNIHEPLFCLRDIHQGYLSLEEADNKQSNLLLNFDKSFDKGIKTFKKVFF